VLVYGVADFEADVSAVTAAIEHVDARIAVVVVESPTSQYGIVSIPTALRLDRWATSRPQEMTVDVRVR
jgi:hypothetical protein